MTSDPNKFVLLNPKHIKKEQILKGKQNQMEAASV